MSKINIMRFIKRDNKPFGFCVYPPGATLGPRVLTDYEFVWIESGAAKWRLNDTEYNIFEDNVLLLQPGNREYFQWNRQKHTSHYFIHFDINWQAEENSKIISSPENWKPIRYLPHNNVLKPMLMHIFWLIKNGCDDSSELFQNAFKQALLTFITGSVELERGIPEDMPPALERVFQYIYRQWKTFPLERPSLETLAGEALVSPTHLCRLFNATFQASPMQTINLMRLKRASGLLARTNYRIKQISHLTGFENQYHFSKTFKAAYLISPSQYRKAAIEGKQLPISKIIVKRL